MKPKDKTAAAPVVVRCACGAVFYSRYAAKMHGERCAAVQGRSEGRE